MSVAVVLVQTFAVNFKLAESQTGLLPTPAFASMAQRLSTISPYFQIFDSIHGLQRIKQKLSVHSFDGPHGDGSHRVQTEAFKKFARFYRT